MGGGYTIHTNPGLQLELVSLYVMLPLSPTHPTSHLPNNAAYDNDRLLREVEYVQSIFQFTVLQAAIITDHCQVM